MLFKTCLQTLKGLDDQWFVIEYRYKLLGKVRLADRPESLTLTSCQNNRIPFNSLPP